MQNDTVLIPLRPPYKISERVTGRVRNVVAALENRTHFRGGGVET